MNFRQFKNRDGGPLLVQVPIVDDIEKWPRFDNYDFGGFGMRVIGLWITTFAKLQTAAALQVALYNHAISQEDTAVGRKKLRATRGIYEAFFTHYKELGKAMSRMLTAAIEELKIIGRD